MFYEECNSTSGPSGTVIFYCIITLNFEINFLVRNVSFRATMSKLFSFKYNSSSLRFYLMPKQFQNMLFVPMKAIIRNYLPTTREESE